MSAITRQGGNGFAMQPQNLDEAMAEARQQMAAMLDHLNALIDQATAEEVPA